jgi:hypothetical protein
VHLQPAGGDRWCPRRLQRHGRGDLQLLGRRPLCRQGQPQGHGEAARVGRRDELFRAGLALGLTEPRRKGDGQVAEGAAASGGTPRASCDAACPVEFGGSLYRCHRILLRPSDSGSGGGLLVHPQPGEGRPYGREERPRTSATRRLACRRGRPGCGPSAIPPWAARPEANLAGSWRVAALARANPTRAPALPLHTRAGTDPDGYHHSTDGNHATCHLQPTRPPWLW